LTSSSRNSAGALKHNSRIKIIFHCTVRILKVKGGQKCMVKISVTLVCITRQACQCFVCHFAYFLTVLQTGAKHPKPGVILILFSSSYNLITLSIYNLAIQIFCERHFQTWNMSRLGPPSRFFIDIKDREKVTKKG
jgi:hypothetical protein